MFWDDAFVHERNWNEKAVQVLKTDTKASYQIALIADSHQNYEDLEAVVRKLNTIQNLNFVAHLGDFTNVGGPLEYTYFIEILRALRIPSVVTLGNHDSLGAGLQIYQRVFGSPNYSFQLGDFNFIILNSNQLETEPIDMEWLENKLISSSGKIKLVFRHINYNHKEYFTTEQSERFRQLMIDTNTQLVIQGHQHVFNIFKDHSFFVLQVPKVEGRQYLLLKISSSAFSISQCQEHQCDQVFNHIFP